MATRKNARSPRPRAATRRRAATAIDVKPSASPGRDFMLRLRLDHARQSRLLREIDALAARLRADPETVRPVLVEAMRYLLQYQHGFHHPREDELFALVQQRAPQFADGMDSLMRQHRGGQRSIGRIVASLDRLTPTQLRGTSGARLARSLHTYADHLRDHMRDEEHVFYARSEEALRAQDWRALLAQMLPEDPMLNPARLRREFPHLAHQLAELATELPGSGMTTPKARTPAAARAREALQRRSEQYAELHAETLLDGLALVRRNVADLRAARSPSQALRLSRAVIARGWQTLVRLIEKWLNFLRGIARELGDLARGRATLAAA